VNILQNFLITIGEGLNIFIVKKIPLLVQISLKIMIDVGIINEKKNYSTVEKDYNPNEHYYKTIISYKLSFSYEENKIFNVVHRFYRHPLQIIDYKFPIQKKNVESENRHAVSIEWLERTLISGPTYVRSENYDKINPYNSNAFQTKNKNLRNYYSETKFYPDTDFINHIRKKFFSYLNYDEIKKKMKVVKNELEKIYEITN
jgi:hypothetical protein